jgi:tRNA uridine 5-carbamoylmethylation protein Kti12
MKDLNSKGKLIMVMGPPASGKSTLAAEVHTELKKRGINSAFVSEAATDYIAEYGVPNSPQDQMIIFYKQLNREKMFLESKDYIICDSSSILNYFYFRSLYSNTLTNKDVASINHIQKEILKHINLVDYIFFVPAIDTETKDGIRFHQRDEIKKLERWIKSYLEIENINHTDLSDVNMKDRVDFILREIISL